jgi:hypothetical protein
VSRSGYEVFQSGCEVASPRAPPGFSQGRPEIEEGRAIFFFLPAMIFADCSGVL